MLSRMHILAKDDDIKVPSRDKEAHKIRSFVKYYQSLVKEHIRISNYLEAATFNLEDEYILKQVKKRIANIEQEQELIIAGKGINDLTVDQLMPILTYHCKNYGYHRFKPIL